MRKPPVSLWHSTAALPRFPALRGEVKTDVLIIGGGLAGVLTAYFLREAGVDCLLVEQRRIGSGTTGNTTAKVTAQHGLLYHRLLRTVGKDGAKAYLQANLAAVERFAALCETIPCGFTRRDNTVYHREDGRLIEAELEALDWLGYTPECPADLPLPFEVAGAVTFPAQGQLHPLQFLAGVAGGLPIRENTRVRELVGTTALTDRGKIRAKRVVVATHFPFLNKHGLYFAKLYQHRSYVLALEGAPLPEGMLVDDDSTGLSFRQAEGLLLLGGGGHRTGKPTPGWSGLEAFARREYPDATVRYRWAAQDCMSLDEMPYVGQYAPSTPHLFVATGFNKWGMTGSMVAARLLCDRLTGQDNPCADLLSPSRRMVKKALLVNGLSAAAGLLSPAKKRCPHLGCGLNWNPVEHSWACPCHGSRFDRQGRCLDNPATGDLPHNKEG